MGMRQTAADIALNVPPGKNDVPYPSKLELVRLLLAKNCECVAGKIAAATGAAMDVATPFDPAFVIVWDATTAALWLKFPSLPDDDSVVIDTAAAGDAAGGITLGTLKFTIGTDAKINALNDVLHWVAFGFRGDTLLFT